MIKTFVLIIIFTALFISQSFSIENKEELVSETTSIQERTTKKNDPGRVQNLILNLGEENLKMSNRTISLSTLVIGLASFALTAITIIIILFGIFGFKSLSDLNKTKSDIQEEFEKIRTQVLNELNNIKNKIKDAESTHKDLLETSMEIRSKFLTHMGYGYWEIGRAFTLSQASPLTKDQQEQRDTLLGHAITFTEDALKLLPSDDVHDSKKLASMVQTRINLAFYYSELNDEERHKKREIALDYAQFALEKMLVLSQFDEIKSRHLSGWKVDYGVIKLRFANSLDEIKEAIDYFEQISKAYPKLKKEVSKYIEEAKSKQEKFESS